ncbi:MAG TPA: phosphoribosylamine--glycine ligase [Candidatus Levybacteria bacterium]|nr:phosphoribosylamine--glycine ligase [Candidatus Levybacteria bacterium]
MIESNRIPNYASEFTGDRRIRVVGSGFREHALLELTKQSPQTAYVDISPGNAGTQEFNVPISATNIRKQVEDAQARNIDLVIVGPEEPLALGIRDQMNAVGIDVFGPTAEEARIESDKWFAIQLMREAGVVHPYTEAFYDEQTTLAYIKNRGVNTIVIKENGLRAGKGVTVPDSLEEVSEALTLAFGENYKQGQPLLVQDKVEGVEVSFIAVVDGEHIVPLLPSQDYKRVGDNDTGPNTGGMGAIAPSPTITPDLQGRIMKEVMYPIVQTMRERGMNYQGILYAGLMIEPSGNLNTIEFNCRGGDPEFPVISTLLTPNFDIVELADSVRNGTLEPGQIRFLEKMSALGIVVASQGYPQEPILGKVIEGLDQKLDDHSFLFQAGTKRAENKTVSSGGRIALGIGRGRSFNEAKPLAKKVVDTIILEEKIQRQDIGDLFINNS